MKFDAYDILDSIYMVITDTYTKDESIENKYNQIKEAVLDYFNQEENDEE